MLVLMACLGLGALLHRQDLSLAGPIFALLIIGFGLLAAGQEQNLERSRKVRRF